ncbi:MAG: hypothetical protein ABII07_04005 [Patescibacteria group bacterium]|nr:hypothetical protein [Patescibacteria group bacterium]
MKKLLLLPLLLLLLLTGCLGNVTPEENTDNPLYYKYSGATYSIEVPNDWEVISQFTSDYPSNTLVAFKNNLKDQDFIANVNIVANTLGKGLGNGDYAIEMLKYHEGTLIDYKLLEQQEVEVIVAGQSIPTYLNYFEGRNSVSSDLLRFLQVYVVSENFGYIATATFLPDEDEFIFENCKHMVKSLAVN